MPAARARVRKSSRVGKAKAHPHLALVPGCAADVKKAPEVPVRGVPLKTVSRLTMLFAITCLAAFLASRPPASAYRLADMQKETGIAAEAATAQKHAAHGHHKRKLPHQSHQSLVTSHESLSSTGR